jgi:hypothetical protein
VCFAYVAAKIEWLSAGGKGERPMFGSFGCRDGDEGRAGVADTGSVDRRRELSILPKIDAQNAGLCAWTIASSNFFVE